MRMDYFKSKLFLKYIWSYLFILLIPLVFMTAFIYENAVKTLRTEIESSRLAQLSQTNVTIDSRMKELSEIASLISYDDRLSSYRVTNDYTSPVAISALDQYKSTSSMIDEIYLYFHDDERIYSSKGLTNIDVFADNLNFAHWDEQSLYNELNEVKYPTIRPADLVTTKTGGVQGRKLAYLIPITPNSLNPHATIMYLIKESEITNLINSILGNYQGLTFVLNAKGEVLVANHQGDTLSEGALQLLFDHTAPGIQERELDGKEHSIVSVQSESNGWTYMTVMPSSQFFSSVVDVRSFMSLMITVVLLVGIAIAIVLARMQYQPISTLVEFASSRFPEKQTTGKQDYRNELDRIRSALQDYRARINLQEPFARNHYLSSLIKFGDSDHLSPDLQQTFDIKLNRNKLFVMVIGFHESKISDIQHRHRINNNLSLIECPELQANGYGVELSQLDRFGVIINYDPSDEIQDETTQMKLIIEKIRSLLINNLSVTPMIGAGGSYHKLSELNQSYIEACSAFDLLVPGELGTTALFEELSKTPSHSFWIPNHIQLKLIQSLKQGNYNIASQMIHSSIDSLQSSMLPALLVRCISFDLLNTILKTASELGEHHMLQKIAPSMVFSSSLEELESVLLSLASQLCTEVELDSKQEEQSLIDRIVEYIDAHFTDHSLSLDTIAYKFEISPSHVSRSFKDKTGINFIQYIWQKRLDRIMHQLKMTDTPLKDLILEVGYLDTPNFIRKFKKENGFTPGQYRKMHRETTSNKETGSAS